ncbi:MAG: hypothetical protein KDD66_00275 [Bdellovibrionales bacterium]|nr:hypothetical protein [Bdellovibrionales bacterium]
MKAVLKMTVRGLGTALIIAAAAASASAEDNQPTRDRDGKPYRIDGESGFRIKDHIADLEVQVDDLKRQVVALENELSAKQDVIDRVSGGGSLKPALQEQNIKTSSAVRRTSDTAVDGSCRTIVVPLNKRIDRLEEDLRLARQTPGSATAVNTSRSTGASGEIVACRAERDNLQTQVTRLQTALMDSPSKESYALEQQKRAKQAQELGGLQSTLETQEQQLDQSQQTIAALKSEVAQYKQKFEAEAKENKSLQMQLASANNAASSAPSARARAKAAPVRAVASDSASSVNAQALNQAKSRLNTQLASIQRLIGSRKDKLDAVKHSGRGVSVGISPLKTRNNQSLDALRLKVRRMQFPEQEFQISTGLKEIEKVLESDIQVLSRLAR